MDKQKLIRNLRQMPQAIKKDVETWNRAVESGNRQFSAFCRKHLRRPLKRWDRCIKIMQHILEILRNIKERTERLWRRVRLWKEDENLKQYYISSNLHDFLEFLTKRYDYEWEVKEMVVRKFKYVTTRKIVS